VVELGAAAPDFTLPDTDRRPVRLADFRGKKVVLAFFPGAFTKVCQKELCEFRDMLGKLEGLGAQVVGISADSPWANGAFAAANRLPFPILSDYTREVARAWGGVHEDFAGLGGYTAPKRAVFVVDPQGVVRYRWVTEDPGVEPPYGEIERVLGTL